MDAQRFYGGADGPHLMIDRATNGTPLMDGRGWTCGCCEAIWATEEGAEVCCDTPEQIESARSLPAQGRWLRLYTPG